MNRYFVDKELYDNLSANFNDLEIQLDKYKNVIDKIKEIFKDYGDKEDISGITMYYILGESLIHILELLEEVE